MSYRIHRPAAPLDAFIERIWSATDVPAPAGECISPADLPSHVGECILPTGTFELVFNLHEDEVRIYDRDQPSVCRRLPGAVFSGAYRCPFLIDGRQHISMMGVHFRPGGAYPFLCVHAAELTGSHVDLRDVWGRSATSIREQLCSAASPEERFLVLERALIERLKSPRQTRPEVAGGLRLLECSGEETRIRDVTDCIGVSHRRFIELFEAEVGLTPKTYQRIRRFQRTRLRVNLSPEPDWCRIAQDCGYFDQSHLIQEFRVFSGLSPTEYLRRVSEQLMPNHLPQPG